MEVGGIKYIQMLATQLELTTYFGIRFDALGTEVITQV